MNDTATDIERFAECINAWNSRAAIITERALTAARFGMRNNPVAPLSAAERAGAEIAHFLKEIAPNVHTADTDLIRQATRRARGNLWKIGNNKEFTRLGRQLARAAIRMIDGI